MKVSVTYRHFSAEYILIRAAEQDDNVSDWKQYAAGWKRRAEAWREIGNAAEVANCLRGMRRCNTTAQWYAQKAAELRGLAVSKGAAQ